MSERKELMKGIRRIVVKVGTSSITKGDSVSIEFMDSISRQVRSLKDSGVEVLIVTSGAIGLGLQAMRVTPNPKDIPTKQAAASVGQSILMGKWGDSLSREGLLAGQILLTMDIYSDREGTLNLNNTIDALLKNDVIPVFNENDAVSIKEIGSIFGDNDTLSAIIASSTDSDVLVILSDVEGLYDKNPKIHADAKFISLVKEITPEIIGMGGDPTSKVGVGGMRTKINAATICRDAECMMVIASNSIEDSLVKIINGDDIGTLFISDRSISKKKRWIKSAKAYGRIIVDNGAEDAIMNHKSLLPIGIVEVQGQFAKGDIVSIVCDGLIIAKATPEFSSEDLDKVKGLHSSEIQRAIGKSQKDAILSENIVIMFDMASSERS